MRVHFHQICQYGWVHDPCRNPDCGRTFVRVTCPPEFDAGHAAARASADPEQGLHDD